MSVLPKVHELPEPEATVPIPLRRFDGHLPDETKLARIAIGIGVGVPVAAVFGGGLIYATLMGTPAEVHALVLSLPFGGMFGFLGGAIGGLMATMRH